LPLAGRDVVRAPSRYVLAESYMTNKMSAAVHRIVSNLL
jgi:hypothetical protein